MPAVSWCRRRQPSPAGSKYAGSASSRSPHVGAARLALVVDLVEPAAIERLPQAQHCLIDDVRIPVLRLAPFEASAPLKLLLCLWRVMQQNP